MTEKNDPRQEGHTREWQDRARVVLDAKKAAQTEASPKQSPEPDKSDENIEENTKISRREDDDGPVY